METSKSSLNKTKVALKDGKAVVGTIANIPSPALVEALGWAGLDFVWFDSEHGPLGIETLESMVRAADVSGTTPVVRVARNDPTEILRCLDVGAMGLHVPDVATADEARSAVEAMKYHPQGKRGLSLSHRAARYGQVPCQLYIENANQQTMLVVHIEDAQGVDNAEEILAVPGIDVVFLGLMDLSQSLGVPGETRHERVVEGVQRIAAAAAHSSVAVGAIANTLEEARALQQQGVRYLVLSTIPRILSTHLKDVRTELVGAG